MLLGDPVAKHFRLVESQKQALAKLGVATVRDLLFHLPFRFEAGGESASIAGLTPGMDASIVGTIEKLETKKSWKRKVPIAEGYLRDSTGRIKMMFFNQPYIAKMWAAGATVQAVGKVAGTAGKIYLANPQLQRISVVEAGLFAQEQATIQIDGTVAPRQHSSEKVLGSPVPPQAAGGPDSFLQNIAGAPTDTPTLFPVYAESRGITSLWFRHALERVMTQTTIDQVEDPIPADLLKRYNLPTLRTALVWMHKPEKLSQAEAARKRFAFEEIFLIQLQRQQERALQAHEQSFAIDAPKKEVGEFMSTFPFTATPAQMHAVNAILTDMRSGKPMSRLLEGDVGSGKTAVAATACYAAVRTRPKGQTFGTLQVAYMAPTEILAKQHFESFIKYFVPFPVNIGLITGSGCFKFPSKSKKGEATNISRTQLLKWVANGEIPILIGTHALIQKSVQFKHLALVIIDEQHRFGTNQRRKLAHRDGDHQLPHLLSMTATPIPRTLALTVYGDLDLTLLDQMPPGRKPIITEIVKPDERAKAYAKIRSELALGRQAYVICPRIDEPDPDKAFALMAKSVTAEAKRLKKEVFPEYTLAILHSKMTPKEKEDTMAKFSRHEVDILVATSVVEVGVNVPNATMIFIEGAERFGLAQLHQLRGRVVRSNHQAYCFVCPESRGEQTLARLRALATAKNGFELAEKDLLQRGAGELAGKKQWGISDIGMEALKNLKLVEAARAEAQALVKSDETLAKHPLLLEAIVERAKQLHFE